MVKHTQAITQAIRRLLPTNCLNVFDHFWGLALKGLTLHFGDTHRLLYKQSNSFVLIFVANCQFFEITLPE